MKFLYIYIFFLSREMNIHFYFTDNESVWLPIYYYNKDDKREKDIKRQNVFSRYLFLLLYNTHTHTQNRVSQIYEA